MRMTGMTAALMFVSLIGIVNAEEPNLLVVPKHTGAPQPEHAVTNRAFQGIPSMAITPGGRLWANWYAGKTPGEDKNNYVVLTTSCDSGKTWKEVLVVDPDGEGPIRTFDPELWMAPDGHLRLFWAQAQGHEATVGGVWMMEAEEPESEQAAWKPPVRITDGVMMCKLLVLSSGEWVLPASTWRKTDNSAKMVVSEDKGRTARSGCWFGQNTALEKVFQRTAGKRGLYWSLRRLCIPVRDSSYRVWIQATSSWSNTVQSTRRQVDRT